MAESMVQRTSAMHNVRLDDVRLLLETASVIKATPSNAIRCGGFRIRVRVRVRVT
jgi:hypothetical protein